MSEIEFGDVEDKVETEETETIENTEQPLKSGEEQMNNFLSSNNFQKIENLEKSSSTLINENIHNKNIYKPDSKRWIMLTIFSCLSFTNV